MKSIKANNPNIGRVVITSSFASIIDLSKGLRPGYTYTEKDWNPSTYEEAAASKDGVKVYCDSKKLAEEAAFDFVKTEKPNFTISTICPPMVYGPIAHKVTNINRLNESSEDLWKLINGSSKEVPPTGFWAWADVRDLGKAHRLAYESEKAANERFLITSGNYSFQIFADIIRKNFPELKDKTPEGKPGSGLGVEVYGVDNSKAKTVLGLEFRDAETSITDSITRLLEIQKKLGAS